MPDEPSPPSPETGAAPGTPEGYLTTILTYGVPSEAEVDKAFLESRGIAVCLLNANTSRNELGTPFYIQLQVGAQDAEEARRLIREVNPQRFGSKERVDEIDRQVKRALARFVLVAVPTGLAVAAATYLLVPQPERAPTRWVRRHLVVTDARVELALTMGIAASVAVAAWGGRSPATGPGSSPEAPPSAPL